MGVNNLILQGLDSTSSATDLVPITPDDDNDLAKVGRAIRCQPTGSAGTLRFTSFDGPVRDTSIAAGETLVVMAVRIHATGTTATSLEAFV